MRLLGWLGDKLNRGTLKALERMLTTTARRAELDARFASTLQNSVQELLSSLFPAKGLSPSTHLLHVQMFLDRPSPAKLDSAASRIFWIAKNSERAGMAVEASAAGIVAGWFTAAAMRYRDSERVVGEATKLKGDYEAFLMKLFLSGDSEGKSEFTKEPGLNIVSGRNGSSVYDEWRRTLTAFGSNWSRRHSRWFLISRFLSGSKSDRSR